MTRSVDPKTLIYTSSYGEYAKGANTARVH